MFSRENSNRISLRNKVFAHVFFIAEVETSNFHLLWGRKSVWGVSASWCRGHRNGRLVSFNIFSPNRHQHHHGFFLLFIACPRHLLGEIRHGYDCCTRSKTGARIVEAAISVCRAVAIGACASPSSSYFNKARLTVTAYNSKYSSSQMWDGKWNEHFAMFLIYTSFLFLQSHVTRNNKKRLHFWLRYRLRVYFFFFFFCCCWLVRFIASFAFFFIDSSPRVSAHDNSLQSDLKRKKKLTRIRFHFFYVGKTL